METDQPIESINDNVDIFYVTQFEALEVSFRFGLQTIL
jgi:hypothetical protein